MLEMKDVKSTGGKYQIREDGVLFRFFVNEREPEARYGKVDKGYCQFRISFNDGPRSVYLHRLVAEAFLPNPDNLPCVDHIDENKNNNRVDNLRWCTAQENMHYFHNGSNNRRVVQAKNLLKKAKAVKQEIIDLNSEIQKSIHTLKTLEKNIISDIAKLDKKTKSVIKYEGYKNTAGITFGNVEQMVKAVGKPVTVENVGTFPSAGAAANFIVLESGKGNKKDISRRIRKYKSSPESTTCIIYKKYKIL